MTEQVGVTTRVPPEQKQRWAADAERLEMSQSEFVRTMVQAGRRELGLEADERPTDTVEPDSSDATPGGAPLEDRVLGVLAEQDAVSWDELVAELTSDLEERLDETLSTLQADGRVTYSGRRGGYVCHE